MAQTTKPHLKLLARQLAENVNNPTYPYQQAIKDIEQALDEQFEAGKIYATEIVNV